MRRLIFLFLVVLVVLPGISAVEFPNDISYTPFIFGVLKGDDGSSLSLNQNNFTEGKLQERVGSDFTDKAPLTFKLNNNSNVVFIYPNNTSTLTGSKSSLYRFNFKFNQVPGYENKNMNVLFRFG